MASAESSYNIPSEPPVSDLAFAQLDAHEFLSHVVILESPSSLCFFQPNSDELLGGEKIMISIAQKCAPCQPSSYPGWSMPPSQLRMRKPKDSESASCSTGEYQEVARLCGDRGIGVVESLA